MSIILAPGTLSPARLALKYAYRTVRHQVSVNVLAGVNVNNLTVMRAAAIELAVATQGVLNSDHIIDGWAILTHEGQSLYEESFASVYVGTHGSSPGMPDYYSPTVKVLGKGRNSGLNTGTGRTSYVLFTGSTYPVPAGSKYLSGPDTALLALIDVLNNSDVVWADYFGQKANYSGRIAVQFNAHEQKRSGS